ncbi:MAG: conjugative transposon protein TraJ [Agriterribacter sp.]
MRRVIGMFAPFFIAGILLPQLSFAQTITGWADDIKSLHSVLDQLYDDMIPRCGELISIGRSIAAFAALWYIASRVWGHIVRAESIDFYPLFRPFVIGFAILIFPSVIALINGVMKPTVSGTSAMVENADVAIAVLLKEKENAIKNSDVYKMYVGPTGEGDRDKWYKYTHPDEEPDGEGWMASIGNDIRFAMAKFGYNFRNAIKEVLAEILQLLFAAASLAINTMRTFNLIILAILGPLVFGLSVFNGFHHTLKQWLARYINVFLWLPIANIFGAVIGIIQENMLKIDINQIEQSGDTFFSRTDLGYMIFMIIGILGYFSVPSIANQVMWVGGSDSLTGRTTSAAMAAGGVAGAATGAVMSRGVSGAANIMMAPYNVYEGYKEGGESNTSASSRKSGDYLHDKLSGS